MINDRSNIKNVNNLKQFVLSCLEKSNLYFKKSKFYFRKLLTNLANLGPNWQHFQNNVSSKPKRKRKLELELLQNVQGQNVSATKRPGSKCRRYKMSRVKMSALQNVQDQKVGDKTSRVKLSALQNGISKAIYNFPFRRE